MARENPGWGYTRIREALRNLGHEIGRNKIKRVLAANGIEPTLNRRKGMFWETFVKLHWGAISAADFLTVDVLTHMSQLHRSIWEDCLCMSFLWASEACAGSFPNP